MVQTMKQGLRKTLLHRQREDWDLFLPYVAMGYRMKKQASSGYTPYFLLYGRHPLFQAAHQSLSNRTLPFDLSNPDTLNNFIVKRGHIFQEVMPLAMRNVAQQQDVHRYRRVHGGGY